MKPNTADIICLNGIELLQYDHVVQQIIQSPGFLSGCFETMLSLDGRMPLLVYHLERLSRSMDHLGLNPPGDFSPEKISDVMASVYARKELSDENKKVGVTGKKVGDVMASIYTHKEVGDESKEVGARYRVRLTMFEPQAGHTDWMLQSSVIVHPSPPVRLRISKIRRQAWPDDRAMNCKLSSRKHYTDAYYEAITTGFDDALMLSLDGFVSETTIANIVWHKKGNWHTPSSGCFPLNGIGLKVLVSGLKREKEEVVSGEFYIDELLRADAAWIINSVRGPVPVTGIEGHELQVDKSLDHEIQKVYWDEVARYA